MSERWHPPLAEQKIVKDAKEAQQPIEAVKANLVADFGIAKEFFDNPINKVAFDAAANVLAKESSEVLDEVQAKEFAKRFLETWLKPPASQEKDKELYAILETKEDTALSEKVTALCAFSNPNSLLAAHRARLGITKPDDEKPYRIVVVKQDRRGTPSKERLRARWKKLTGSESQFFIGPSTINDLERPPTIFIPDSDAKALLGEKAEDDGAFKIIHEWRHTQRDFRSSNKRLLNLVNEVYTNGALAAYLSETALLSMLTCTTDDCSRTDFMHAYERGDQAEKAQVLEAFQRNFGAEGFLLLAGHKVHYEDDDVGVDNMPLVAGKYYNEEMRFAETLLALRQRSNPKYFEIFRKNLFNIPLGHLQLFRGFGIGRYTYKSEESDAPNVRQMEKIINEVIAEREKSGEKGL